MNRYSQLLLAQAGTIFILVFSLLFLVFSKDKTEGHITRRRGIYQSFSLRTSGYILLAALAITYIVSQFAQSGLTTALVFIAILGLAPLMLNNARKRIRQEDLFSEVILFCQSSGMLLKQTHNVYSSLQKASEDLVTSLRPDIEGLLAAMEEGREETMAAMRVLESNYPYSCIRNLDVILLHMFYETSHVDDSLLETYQDDVSRLEQDVRKNKEKRKALRLSYILITAGSVAAYWYFIKSLSDTFSGSFNSSLFRILNMVYVFGTMFAFFFVDRYFNLNTTKE